MFWFGEENLTCLLTGGLAVLSLVDGVGSLVGLNISLPGGVLGCGTAGRGPEGPIAYVAPSMSRPGDGRTGGDEDDEVEGEDLEDFFLFFLILD